MPNVSDVMEWNGHRISRTWMRTDDASGFSPVTQCYGICFDDIGRILAVREKGKDWQLPGGTPELGETLEETVTRELIEEADIVVKDVRMLGVQKVEFPGNLNKNEGELFYQARFICEVDSVLPQTVDPVTGETWERKFVPTAEINDCIRWGEIGRAVFDDAVSLRQALQGDCLIG